MHGSSADLYWEQSFRNKIAENKNPGRHEYVSRELHFAVVLLLTFRVSKS